MNRIIKLCFFILLFNCSENHKKLKNNNLYIKLAEESESLKIDINKSNSINFINKGDTLILLNKKLKNLEQKLKKILKSTFKNPRLIFILTHELIKLDIERNICEISAKNKHLNKEITKIIFEYYLDINLNFEIKDEIIKDKNDICEKIKVLNYPVEKEFYENKNYKSMYIYKNPSSLFELNFIENKSIDSFYYELKYYYFNCCLLHCCICSCCSKEKFRDSYKIFWGLEDIKENILFKKNVLNM